MCIRDRIGALLMAVIRNGLNLMGASNDIQYIVIGAVIILAVTIDVFRNKAAIVMLLMYSILVGNNGRLILLRGIFLLHRGNEIGSS